MASLLIFVFVNLGLAYFLISLPCWIFSVVLLSFLLLLCYKKKHYNKLSNVLLLISLVFSFFAYLNSFNPSIFYILMNLSALFASLKSIYYNNIFLLISWILNAVSFGYLISGLKSLTLGIIFSIIIFLLGIKDVFSTKKIQRKSEK